MRTLKGAGILMGGSLGAFTVSAFVQMLGNIDGSKVGRAVLQVLPLDYTPCSDVRQPSEGLRCLFSWALVWFLCSAYC